MVDVIAVALLGGLTVLVAVGMAIAEGDRVPDWWSRPFAQWPAWAKLFVIGLGVLVIGVVGLRH